METAAPVVDVTVAAWECGLIPDSLECHLEPELRTGHHIKLELATRERVTLDTVRLESAAGAVLHTWDSMDARLPKLSVLVDGVECNASRQQPLASLERTVSLMVVAPQGGVLPRRDTFRLSLHFLGHAPMVVTPAGLAASPKVDGGPALDVALENLVAAAQALTQVLDGLSEDVRAQVRPLVERTLQNAMGPRRAVTPPPVVEGGSLDVQVVSTAWVDAPGDGTVVAPERPRMLHLKVRLSSPALRTVHSLRLDGTPGSIWDTSNNCFWRLHAVRNHAPLHRTHTSPFLADFQGEQELDLYAADNATFVLPTVMKLSWDAGGTPGLLEFNVAPPPWSPGPVHSLPPGDAASRSAKERMNWDSSEQDFLRQYRKEHGRGWSSS